MQHAPSVLVSDEKVFSHVAENAPNVSPFFSAVSMVSMVSMAVRCLTLQDGSGVHLTSVEQAILVCKK